MVCVWGGVCLCVLCNVGYFDVEINYTKEKVDKDSLYNKGT